MGYIVTAKVYVNAEKNMFARSSEVDARILDVNSNYITFDVKGEHGEEAGIVGALCRSLVQAGYFEFEINHSY